MPVDRKLGDIVHAKLIHWLAGPDPWRRLVGRIGLGTEPGVDIARLPLQFTRAVSTARDGRLLCSLGSDAFATLHNGRIVGALDAGEAQFDVSRLEDEPCYVSGVGFANEVPDVPSIVFVFAIGRTTAQAFTRGCAVFESFDVPAKPHFVLKVARVAPIDGQLLRCGWSVLAMSPLGSPDARSRWGWGNRIIWLGPESGATCPMRLARRWMQPSLPR